MTSPDPHGLPYEAKIAELTTKLEQARERVASLETELDWWQRGRDLFGTSAASNASASGRETVQSSIPFRKPTLAQAIERVIADSNGQPLATPQIIESLAERGWMPTGSSAQQAVRTKLSQLARGDDAALRRVGHGVYTLNQPDAVVMVPAQGP